MTQAVPPVSEARANGGRRVQTEAVWRPHGTPGNQRIEAFTDGVFAIAITLLVLELRVPDHLPQSGLASLLPEMLPKLAGHAISFLVVGAYWVGHNNMFMHIRRHDRVFMWLNVLFLMFIGVMPFFAGLMVNYTDDEFSLVAYTGNLVLAGLVLDCIWWYASDHRRLVNKDMDADLIAFVHRRALASPVLYLIVIGISFVSHWAAVAFLLVVPLLYVLPTPLVSYHDKLVAGGPTRDSKLEEEE